MIQPGKKSDVAPSGIEQVPEHQLGWTTYGNGADFVITDEFSNDIVTCCYPARTKSWGKDLGGGVESNNAATPV